VPVRQDLWGYRLKAMQVHQPRHPQQQLHLRPGLPLRSEQQVVPVVQPEEPAAAVIKP
jgi:hypothetical protein